MTITKKLVLAPIIVLMIVGVTSAFILDFYLQSVWKDRIKEELSGIAASAMVAVNALGQGADIVSLDALADRLGRSNGARITFVDGEGVVLGDSDLLLEELREVKNLKSRPEIQSAIRGGYGFSERYSTTVNSELMYVATQVTSKYVTTQQDPALKSRFIIARAALPLTNINKAIAGMRWGYGLIIMASFSFAVFLGLVASRVLAKAIQNERTVLEQRVSARTKEISLLQNMSGLLNACTTAGEAGKILTQILPQLLPDVKGVISVMKPHKNKFSVLASWGGEWPGAESYKSNECWALRKGHHHTSREQETNVVCEHLYEYFKGEAICIPLLAQGETFGVLHLISNTSHVTENEFKIAISAAEQIGLALANLHLRNDLRQQAIRDPLTGIYNRRYMMETLQQEFSRAKRLHSTIGLLMIDLDHFKKFNDTFGHDIGDLVLKRVARELRKNSRAEDTVCRYGGEEFCLVCPDISLENVQHLAEKFRKRIRNLDIRINQRPIDTVTLSIGVALFPHHAHDAELLLKSADEALYRAKAEGRDRVVVSLVNKAGVKSQFLLI
jgi:diguanylate cyclase (GGDEF)-like protein